MLSLSAVAVSDNEVGGITVTVVVKVMMQVSPIEFTEDTLTVYVVVVVGEATGLEMFGLSSEAGGDQL